MTPEAMAALHRQSITTPAPWNADTFAQMCADPAITIIESPKGFAIGRIAGPEAEILTIATLPDYRNTGHGSKMLVQLLDGLYEKGAREIFLEVADNNTPAIQLYEKYEFTVVGSRKNYFRTPEAGRIDAHIMRLNLTKR